MCMNLDQVAIVAILFLGETFFASSAIGSKYASNKGMPAV